MLANVWVKIGDFCLVLALLVFMVGCPITIIMEAFFDIDTMEFVVFYIIGLIIFACVYIPMLYVLMLIDVFTFTDNKWEFNR